MLKTTRLHHSFHGIEFQTIFKLSSVENGLELSCIIEEVCEQNGRTIVEAASTYYPNNVIESRFYVSEQSENDELSVGCPFSNSDNILALLKINHLATTIITAFFNISHDSVKLFNSDYRKQFKTFIEEEIESHL